MDLKDVLRGGAVLAALLTTIIALLVLADGSEARETEPDTAAPDTREENSPGSPTAKTRATFAFGTPEPADARFRCPLDGGRFRPCESPAGNMNSTPASRSRTVDLTSPQTLLTVGEKGQTATVRFEFSADGPLSGFYCSLDGAPSSRCTGPHEYAGLRAGNVDPTPETASWTVAGDEAPVVTIEGAPRIESYHEYHHFRFSADVAGSSFYCSLDEEPFVRCASGGYRYVPYGPHSFGVYAVSPDGVRGEAAVVEYESRDPNWD